MPIHIPWMQDYPSSIARELIRYEELEIQIKQITGYNFDTLLKLFAMGWTLEKPKNEFHTLTIDELPSMQELMMKEK